MLGEMLSILDEFGLITESQKEDISKINNTVKLSNYLSDNDIILDTDEDTINRLAIFMTASAGAEYESTMAGMLGGYQYVTAKDEEGKLGLYRKPMSDTNHNIFVDKHIDAFRKAREEEEDLNMEIKALKRAKNRALKKAG